MTDKDFTDDVADDVADVTPLPPLTDPSTIADDQGDKGAA